VVGLDLVAVLDVEECVDVDGAVEVDDRVRLVLELVFVVVCEVRLDVVDRVVDVEVEDVAVEVVVLVVLVEPLPVVAFELCVVLDVRVVAEDGPDRHHLTHFTIRCLTGRCIADTGVPAGTWTLKVRCCPVVMVTLTTQVSACADGTKPTGCIASTVPTVKTATLSVRRLIRSAPAVPIRGDAATRSEAVAPAY
jgi:hypothetical protein